MVKTKIMLYIYNFPKFSLCVCMFLKKGSGEKGN